MKETLINSFYLVFAILFLFYSLYVLGEVLTIPLYLTSFVSSFFLNKGLGILFAVAPLLHLGSIIVWFIFLYKFIKKDPTSMRWSVYYLFSSQLFNWIIFGQDLFSSNQAKIIGTNKTLVEYNFGYLSTIILAWLVVYIYIKLANWQEN